MKIYDSSELIQPSSIKSQFIIVEEEFTLIKNRCETENNNNRLLIEELKVDIHNLKEAFDALHEKYENHILKQKIERARGY